MSSPSFFSRRHGFTLVELLVVISIISVLLALMLPSLKNARQAALASRCGSQLRQSGISLMRYAADHKDWGPERVYLNGNAFSGRWINDYLPNPTVLRCPTDTVRPSAPNAIGGLLINSNTMVLSSYIHLFGTGGWLGSTSTTDDHDHFYGWRVIYTSSHCGLPNLGFLSRSVAYTNKNFNTTRIKTFPTPALQPIATDGYNPNGVYFNGAVPLNSPPATSTWATNQRNVMHPEYDGLNVQYADGHVTWLKENQVTLRFTTGSGSVTDVYW